MLVGRCGGWEGDKGWMAHAACEVSKNGGEAWYIGGRERCTTKSKHCMRTRVQSEESKGEKITGTVQKERRKKKRKVDFERESFDLIEEREKPHNILFLFIFKNITLWERL